MCRSEPQIPQKATSTRTSPAPGSGSGSSASDRPRSSVTWTARIAPHSSSRRSAAASAQAPLWFSIARRRMSRSAFWSFSERAEISGGGSARRLVISVRSFSPSVVRTSIFTRRS